MAVGNEPKLRGKDLPLGFPVTEIRAASVREHHRHTRALVHILEVNTIHMNVRHEIIILGQEQRRAR